MHITDLILRLDIFTVGNSLNIFIEHDFLLNIIMIFGIKRKIDHFDPYNVFLAIATNIPPRLQTGFVVQDHLCYSVI